MGENGASGETNKWQLSVGVVLSCVQELKSIATE